MKTKFEWLIQRTKKKLSFRRKKRKEITSFDYSNSDDDSGEWDKTDNLWNQSKTVKKKQNGRTFSISSITTLTHVWM